MAALSPHEVTLPIEPTRRFGGQVAEELPASELTASVALDYAVGDLTAHRDGVLERANG